MSTKRAMFIGRWQPLHSGHMWLINQKLAEGAPVLIAVRDIPPDEKNPFTTSQTIEMLQKTYEDHDVVVIPIPDIESVNYGRGVGYGMWDISLLRLSEIKSSVTMIAGKTM